MNSPKETNLEKAALSVLALVIVAILGWVGVTVNQNQLQYARIEERLTNQSSMLITLQNSTFNAAQWHSNMDKNIALLEQRLASIEKAKYNAAAHK
jgi:uncharacterized protein HemX